MSMISFSGIGSGLDTKSIVNALVAAEMTPLREQLATRKTGLNTQLSGVGKLKSALSDFQRTLDQLKSADKFRARSATINQDKNISISAAPSAVPGSYQVSVEQLATAQRLTTGVGAFTSGSDPLGAGKLSFFTGSELLPDGSNGFTLEIDAVNSSLVDIRNAINRSADNTIVTAAIVNVDGATPGTVEPRLILTARNPGLDNAITIDVDASSDAGFSAFQMGSLTETSAQNAIIKVNDLVATRSSNSIDDVIAGVSLSLKEADPGVNSVITIGTDNAEIEKNVQSFVDAYNKLQAVIRDLNTERGGMRGDSTIRSLAQSIRDLATGAVNTSTTDFNTLSTIGVSIARDGRMSVDSSVLTARLNDNFSAVSDLFTTEDGIARRLDNSLKAFTQVGGILDNRTEGLNSRLRLLRDNEDRLDVREETLFNRLSRQFNAMDSLVSQINANGSFLVSQLAGMNNSRF